MGNARREATDVAAAVVNSRVEQTDERKLDEFARACGHTARIFAGDSKFDEVECGSVLEEGSMSR
jgi:hypothetical protein